MNLEQSISSLIELHEKLHKTERRFNRIKWIFKPIIVLAFVAVAITSFLPFILPFTTPIILAGVAAVILRLVVYKFVFGDPESKFNKKVKNDLAPLILEAFAENTTPLDVALVDAEAINQSKLFMLRADTISQSITASGFISTLKARLGYLTVANEDITLKSIIKGIADDAEDFITGLSTEYGHERDLENKTFFSGFLIQISKPLSEKEFVVLPSKLAKVYTQKSKYTKGWHCYEVESTTFSIISRSSETILPSTIIQALMAFEKAGARKVYLSIVQDKVTIAFPWAKNWLKPKFEDKRPIDQNSAQLIRVQASLVKSIAESFSE